MARALRLAESGRGSVSPNPMVGAVIVAADNRIIGEGWHRRYGQAHAEVNAVNSVSPDDIPLLSHATIYVTLEPCSHYGKTPPCAEMLIRKGFKRVVVATADPFDKVSGRGIAMLRDAGITVDVGTLEAESRALNATFFTAHTRRRPFVTLKWAQSADGYISAKSSRLQLSTPLTATLMHRQRAMYDAILVGSETLLRDRPRLDVRHWAGRSPRPYIWDRRGRLTEDDIKCTALPAEICRDADVRTLLERLYTQGITSLMVEGGAKVLDAFIQSGLWDTARVEVADDITLGDDGDTIAPTLDRLPQIIRTIEHNNIFWYVNNDIVRVKNL